MRVLQKNATGKTIYILVRSQASSPPGLALTGLAYNTSGLKVYYTRARAAATAITLATQTVTGAWASGGFVEVSATNAPGLYRLDLPDAAIATGLDEVVVSWTGANTVEDAVSITLTDYDPLLAGPTAAAIRTEIDSNSTAFATLLGADRTYVKNVAVTAFMFYMELTDGSPGTSLTVAGTVSKDGSAFASLGASVAEVSSGWYKVNIAQSEMNADEVALKFTATGAKQRNIKIRTAS